MVVISHLSDVKLGDSSLLGDYAERQLYLQKYQLSQSFNPFFKLFKQNILRKIGTTGLKLFVSLYFCIYNLSVCEVSQSNLTSERCETITMVIFWPNQSGAKCTPLNSYSHNIHVSLKRKKFPYYILACILQLNNFVWSIKFTFSYHFSTPLIEI